MWVHLDHVAINDASGSNGVEVQSVAMTADESRTFHAAGYDADNNFISNVAATWSRTGTLDLVNGTGISRIFNPSTAPTSGTIRISYQGEIDATGTITVSSGALASVKVNASPGAGGIEVPPLTLNVGQDLTVYAAGYDQYGNYRGLEEAVWQTTPSLDPQNDLDSIFTFTPSTANTNGTIMATTTVGNFIDATGLITIDPGVLTNIKIRTAPDGGGVEFSGTNMTADETLTLYAAGYDAGDNYLKDESVNWTSIGSLNDISYTGAVLNFSPTSAPTQGIIRAQTGSIIVETPTINVSNGVAAQIIDSGGLSGERTTVAGSTQWIKVKVVDQHGNAVIGTTVSFSPASQMSDATDVTDANGLAETVYTTPREEDQTTVQTSVTGLDPYQFTIYGIRYVSDPGLYPKVVQRGADATFTTTISNPGNVAVPLNISSTNIEFSGGGHTYTATLQSPSILPANNMSITLTWNAEMVHADFPGGAYTPEIQLVGSGSYSSMNGTFTTSPGELTIGDQSITIGNIQVIGPSGTDQILQGDQNVLAKMNVLNVGITLPIDDFPETTIFFRMGGSTFSVSNLQRTDDLTVLQSGLQSELTFTFDVPTNAQLGEVEIYARLSLDNGNLVITPEEPSGSFDVLSSGVAEYVAGSLWPRPVVPSESIHLRLKFLNTGSANIVLNKDQSSVEILGTSIGARNLISQFTLTGGQETEIIFEQMNLSAGLSPGDYDVRWHLQGELTNGFPYDSISVIQDAFRVVQPANLVFSKIMIGPDTVRQGQSDITITYELRNTGGSDANIRDIDHNFRIVGGAAIPANEWIATDIEPEFPAPLEAGAVRSFDVSYALIQTATTGAIQPVPIVSFNDTRTPTVEYESATVQNQNDVVQVIKPASIKIVSLESLAPNGGTVNVNQNFNMRLAVENTGADRIDMARIHIRNNTQQLVRELVLNDIAPGVQKSQNFSLSHPLNETIIYTAKVDTALDMIGNPVVPEQPDDRDEVITYQLPSQLIIDAAIFSRDSLSDSLIVSLDQIFDVRAQITNLGESAFTENGLGSLVLHFPKSHFVFANPFSDSIRNFSSTDSIAVWTLRATNVSAQQIYENITFEMMNVPIDINTNAEVQAIDIIDNQVHVLNEPKGAISATVYFDDPPGTLDGILSTEQQFIVKATIGYNNSIAPTGKMAELSLPFEFELTGEYNFKVDISAGEFPEWTVYAPDRDRDWSDIRVVAEGIDKNSGDKIILNSNDLAVKVVDRATLNMSLDISKLTGTGDTLSVDQDFDLVVLVNKGGTAKTEGSGEVVLKNSPYVSIIGSQDTLKTYDVGEPVSWRLRTNDLLPSKTTLKNKISAFLETYKLESGSSPMEAGMQKPVSLKTRELSAEITDLIQKSFDESSELTVQMTEFPLDENTNEQAYTQDSIKTQVIYIQQAARITISNPQYPDTVSTGQTFTFRVSINAENHLIDALGILTLPESFKGA